MVVLRLCSRASSTIVTARETKQDAKQNAELEEPALAKVTADRVKRRFLFHWIIMVVVKTAGGVTTRVRFLPVILTSLGSKSGTPFYLNHRNRVNTILTHFLRRPTPAESDVVRPTAQRDAAACTRSGAKSVRDRSSSPVADRENLGSGEPFLWSRWTAWDEASVIAQASP